MLNRMVRAAQLEEEVYEEVGHDPAHSVQALWVVVISSVAAGIGAAVAGGPVGMVQMGLMALLTWLLWSLITYLLATTLFHTTTETSYRQLLGTIGFSSSPGVLRILGIIPFLSAFIHLVAQVWMLLAMVVAVRRALDFASTWQAVGVVLPGWGIQAVMVLVVLLLFA